MSKESKKLSHICRRRFEEAVADVTEAIRLLTPQNSSNKDVRRVLFRIKEELLTEMETSNLERPLPTESRSLAAAKTDLEQLKQLAASMDTLSEADLPMMTSSILSESGYSSNI